MTKRYLAALICFFILAGCGYRFSGRGKLFPKHIQTIAIPDFENRSNFSQAREFVSRALRDEFLKRSLLRLENDVSKADALLEGQIVSFSTRTPSEGPVQKPEAERLQIVVDIRFINLQTNTIIFENKGITFSEALDLESNDFFSQDPDQLEKIADKFAAKIVIQILENF